jgi:hypothetical protein
VAKLTDSEVRAVIAARLTETLNSTDSELRDDREQALNFYYGRPMGNEMEGRAQVVSKDMMDTVEWMMPSLMRVLVTQQAVQFDPVGPEDEDQAKQETGYVSHVIWKKNPGFLMLYEWIKDALIQKVGYIKYWWDEEEKTQLEEFSGLTEEQAALTMQELESRGKVEVLGAKMEEEGISFRARVKTKYGCAKFECVPPEEVIVDKGCRGSIKKSRFVGHLRRNVTRSELIQEGYSRERVEKLTSYVWDADLSERLARDTVGESNDTATESRDADTASEELQLLECQTYLDADGDGIAELRSYLLAGNDTLEDEEAVEIPWESWTPIPVPHRHAGLSMYDIMEDLQRIKTALQRGLLDNVYFTMNPRIAYDQNAVNVASLQINRPGGHVAVSGPPGMSLMPIAHQPIVDRLLPVIGYVDDVKETRTGVGRMSVGVDADVLAQSTKGAYMDAKAAANQRIEAIARIFAETGLSSFYNSFHALLRRHQDWPTKFKLRNDWVETNPGEWRERTDLTVGVGLGNASKEEIRSNLMLMAQAQEKAGAVPGLVQPQNVFSLARRIQTELGFENDAFFTDPQSSEYQKFMQSQQGRKDPFVEGEEIKAQANMAGKQLDATVKREQMAQDRDLKITEMELDAGVDLAKAGIGAEVAAARGQNPQGNGSAGPARQPAPAGGAGGA